MSKQITRIKPVAWWDPASHRHLSLRGSSVLKRGIVLPPADRGSDEDILLFSTPLRQAFANVLNGLGVSVHAFCVRNGEGKLRDQVAQWVNANDPQEALCITHSDLLRVLAKAGIHVSLNIRIG